MGEIEKIINEAPKGMQYMLKSVLDFNVNIGEKKILDEIIYSMIVLDRKFFVADKKKAYNDNVLPIGAGQTISQPSTVARMILLAGLKEGDAVLEVGAGSGWNAALISFLVYPGNVISVDRIQSLVEAAKNNVQNLKEHLKGNGFKEYYELEDLYFLNEDIFAERKVWKKSFDKIIMTAGIPDKDSEKKVKRVAKELLKENGILVCPYVSGPIVIYRKKGGLRREETKESYVFVPLIEGIE